MKHEGEIVGYLPDGSLNIRILRHSACDSCRAHAFCFPEKEETLLVNALPDDHDLAVGDTVWVTGCATEHRTAAVWFYVIPLILIVGILAIALHQGISEPVSILMALAVLPPYLLVLRLVDKRKTGRIVFRARRKLRHD